MLDLIQWPAALISLAGSWLISSDSKRQRMIGFICFLVGNVCWIAWGLYDHAMALIILQSLYLITSCRGIFKNK